MEDGHALREVCSFYCFCCILREHFKKHHNNQDKHIFPVTLDKKYTERYGCRDGDSF